MHGSTMTIGIMGWKKLWKVEEVVYKRDILAE